MCSLGLWLHCSQWDSLGPECTHAVHSLFSWGKALVVMSNTHHACQTSKAYVVGGLPDSGKSDPFSPWISMKLFLLAQWWDKHHGFFQDSFRSFKRAFCLFVLGCEEMAPLTKINVRHQSPFSWDWSTISRSEPPAERSLHPHCCTARPGILFPSLSNEGENAFFRILLKSWEK